ncbi:hypothetical protein TVAG_069250 [Trichomonas vaginalis G3]|uniref:Uncharacterized protein n=1 Tax=Trichomonas vaginalis (strain ATCC PRA-98 / G3) TaxID=412133 RepID=A2EL80_TRIV3|nr:histone-lysine N-methyltransferase ASH1 family [Trichomonas vaginalis G3]EAY06557.1 hypothetical protein TVAG_069250 [Trichomonas vaginalis G3]KAI5538827.1 histone-lysine N-methyltransferase ASH1 family [Trichomonas vaginalis G3]|eukprot:XP_001318780.1 hypothetical protein [Trichomonas vaginalis G3]
MDFQESSGSLIGKGLPNQEANVNEQATEKNSLNDQFLALNEKIDAYNRKKAPEKTGKKSSSKKNNSQITKLLRSSKKISLQPIKKVKKQSETKSIENNAQQVDTNVSEEISEKNNNNETEIQENSQQNPEEPSTTENEINSIDNNDNINTLSKNISTKKMPVREIQIPTASNDKSSIGFRGINTQFIPPKPVFQNPIVYLTPEEKRLLKKTKKPKLIDTIITDQSDDAPEDIYLNYLEIYHNILDSDYLDIIKSEIPEDLLEILTDLDFDYKMITFTPEYVERIKAHKLDSAIPVPEDPDSELEEEIFRKQKEIDMRKPLKPLQDIDLDSSDFEYQDKMRNVVLDIKDNRGNPKYVSDTFQSDSYYSYPSYSDSYSYKSYQNSESQNNIPDDSYNTDNYNDNYANHDDIESTPLVESNSEQENPEFIPDEEEEAKQEPKQVAPVSLIQEAIEEDNKVRRRRQRIQPEFPVKFFEEEKPPKPEKPKIELKPEDFRQALYIDAPLDNAKATAIKKKSESLVNLEENNKNLPSKQEIIVERVPIAGTNKVKLIKKIVKKVLVEKKVEPKKEPENVEYQEIEIKKKINKKKKKRKTKKTPIVTKEEEPNNWVFDINNNQEEEETKNKEDENDEKIENLVDEIQIFNEEERQKQLEEAKRQEEERIKQEQKQKEEQEKQKQQEAQEKEEKLMQVLQFLKETNQLPPKQVEKLEQKQKQKGIVPKEKEEEKTEKEKEKDEKFSKEKRERSPIYRRKENRRRIELVSPSKYFDDSDDFDTRKKQQKTQEMPKQEIRPKGKIIDPKQFFVEEENQLKEEIKPKIEEKVTEVKSEEKPTIPEQTNETISPEIKEEKPIIEQIKENVVQNQENEINVDQDQQIPNLVESEKQIPKIQVEKIEIPPVQKEEKVPETKKEQIQIQKEIVQETKKQKEERTRDSKKQKEEKIENTKKEKEQNQNPEKQKVEIGQEKVTEKPPTDKRKPSNQIPVEQIASELPVIENEPEKVEEKIEEEEEEEKKEPRIRFTKINCIVDEGWKFYDFKTNNPGRMLGISDKPISLPISPDFNLEDEEKLQKPLLFLDAMTDWKEMSDEVVVSEKEERLQTKNGIIKFEANLKPTGAMTFKKEPFYDRLRRSPSFDFAELEKFSRFFKQEMNKQKKSLKLKDIKFDTNFEVLNIKNRSTKIIHESKPEIKQEMKQEKRDTKVTKPIIIEEPKITNETWDNYKDDLFIEKEDEKQPEKEEITEEKIEEKEEIHEEIEIEKEEIIEEKEIVNNKGVETEKIEEKVEEKTVQNNKVEEGKEVVINNEQEILKVIDKEEEERLAKEKEEQERIAKEKEERKRRKEEMKKAKEQVKKEIEEKKKQKQKLLRQVKKSLSQRVGQPLSYPLPPIVPEIEDEEENELDIIERGCPSYPVDDYIDEQLFELADDDLKKEIEDVAYNLMFDVNLKEAKIYDEINFGFCEKHNISLPKRRAYDIVMSEKEKRDKLVIERKQTEEEMKKQKEREEEENIRREIEERKRQEQIKKLQEDQERREIEERRKRAIEDRKRMELERQKQEEEQMKRKQREEEERRRIIEKEKKKRQKEEEARKQKLLEEQRRREFEERRIRQLEEQKQREEEKLKERKEMEEKRKVELEMEKQKQLRELKENYELRKKELELQKQRKELEEQRRIAEEERKKREMEETKKKLLEKKKKNENSKKKKKIKILDEEIRVQNILKINAINANKLHYVVEEDDEPDEYRIRYNGVLFCKSWPENNDIYADLRDNFPVVFAMTFPDDKYMVNSIETFENLAENPKIVEMGIDMNYEYSLTPLTQAMQPRVQTALQAISTEIETAKDLLEHDKLIVNDIIRQKAFEKL